METSKVSLWFAYVVLPICIVSTGGLTAHYMFEQKEYIKSLEKTMFDRMNENRKGIDKISSGMSLDEKRLRAVLQTEKIIFDYNKKYELNLKTEFIHSLAMIVVDAAAKYPNFDHITLSAVIAHESRFNPKATSPVGAKGLMQLMDGTAEEICYRFAWDFYDSVAYNPEKNVLMGAFYLSKLIDRNRGDLKKALAEYNGGSVQRVRYSFLIQKENGIALDSLQEIETGLLANETRMYPDLVLKKEKFFRERYSFVFNEDEK